MNRLLTSVRRPTGLLLASLGLVAAVLVTSSARAQDLHRLLPADTVLAIGLVDLDGAAPLLDAFITPWTELRVGEALAAAVGGFDAASLLGAAPLDGAGADLALPPELVDLDPWDLLGIEAWVGVSLSPFNPLPAVTLLARVDGETGARFDAVFAQARADGALDLSEGALTFLLTEADGLPLAAARDGDLLALSSNPDVMRGVLRLRQGGREASFGEAPAVAATLGALGQGELVGFLDLGPLAASLAPYASGLGFDASVRRLVSLAQTLGPVAGVTRLTASGTLTTTLRRTNGSGGDSALLRLLAPSAAAPREMLDWVPEGALAVQVSSLDPRALWGYLGGLVADLSELGIPDLNRTVRDVLGVDLGRDLFGWTAPGLAIIQTSAGELAPIGAPADNLLGESVIGLRAQDPSAAEAGLARLLDELGKRVALFADPFAAPGATAQVTVRERDAAGVAVRTYDVLPGLTLATAVADGVAWIATSELGLERVLLAGRSGAGAPTAFADLLSQVPADASGFSLSDDRATLEATGASLAQQVQLLAGMTGGGVDFDAIDRATEALDAYLDAIAPRYGGTASWSSVDPDGRLRSDERSEIDLR